jgi:predicted small lipoprotein YifL
MYTKRFTMALLAAVVLLISCGKKGPSYTKYIPKDASYVVAFDVKSMMTKLEQDSLKVENMLDVLKDEKDPTTYATALEYWKQFQDAGLDFDNKMILAIPSLDIEKGEVTAEIVAGLKDAKKLEDFIGKLPNKPKVTRDGDLSLVTTPEFALGWNKDAVIILATGGGTANYGMVDADSLSTTAPAPGSSSVGETLKKYFNLKKDESIASVDAFTDLLAEKADVSMFTNSSSLSTAAGAGAAAAMAMMPKIKELMEGIYSTTTVNFEDGKMVMESNTFAGKKLAELLKKYAGPTADLSLVENYPSQNLNGIVAFSFKPELVPGFLKELGLDALANIGLAETGTNVDEIVKAFKGDFAVVFSDFALKQESMGKDAEYQHTAPSGKLLVAVRIGDKAAFDKLVGLAEKTGGIRRQGNRLVPVQGEDDEISVAGTSFGIAAIEGDLLVYSNDTALFNSYVAKSAKLALPAEARSAISGKSMGMYINVENILKGVPESIFDSTDTHERNILQHSKNVFKSMSFSTGNFDGKKIGGSGEVTMAPGKNSLPQLVRFLMYAASEMKAKDAEREARLEMEEAEDLKD